MSEEYKDKQFAQIDADNKVVTRLIVSDRNCSDENGEFSESIGATFMKELLGGEWLLSELGGSRKGFGEVGHIYDKTKNAFIPPKPYPSWILNEATCQWNAPVAHPNDGKSYNWNEDTTSWEEVI